jgi:hypothetical protein
LTRAPLLIGPSFDLFILGLTAHHRFLCALPGAREYWEFIEGRSGTGEAPFTRVSKLGTFAWLAMAVRGASGQAGARAWGLSRWSSSALLGGQRGGAWGQLWVFSGCLLAAAGFPRGEHLVTLRCGPPSQQPSGSAQRSNTPLPWSNTWLSHSNRNQMTALETMLSIKFGAGLYTKPPPRAVKVAWLAFGGALAGGLVGWQASLWWRARSAEAGGGAATAAAEHLQKSD